MKYIPLAVFVVLACFLFKGLSLNPKELPSKLLDKPVPQFTLPSLLNESDSLTTTNFKGKISLLNVWATWCFACQDDHVFLMKLAKQGVNIIGLDYKDNRKQALNWLRSRGNPYQAIGFDKLGRVAIDLGVYGTPETFLIDEKGIIRYRHVGVLNDQTWRDLFMPRIKQLSNHE